MPEQAEFVADDTGAAASASASSGPPYIRYAPWEPAAAPSYDLRTLTDKVAGLEQRLARLEGMIQRREGEL